LVQIIRFIMGSCSSWVPASSGLAALAAGGCGSSDYTVATDEMSVCFDDGVENGNWLHFDAQIDCVSSSVPILDVKCWTEDAGDGHLALHTQYLVGEPGRGVLLDCHGYATWCNAGPLDPGDYTLDYRDEHVPIVAGAPPENRACITAYAVPELVVAPL
jgi:hypothetical protein